MDELHGCDLADLTDEEVTRRYDELHRKIERLEIARLRALAQIDERELYADRGHLSASAWIVASYRTSWSKAVADVALARSLDHMPRATRAFDANQISLSALSLLAQAHQAEPGAFVRDQSVLVDAARVHPIADLRRALTHWRHLAARERLGASEGLRSERRLHASVTLHGMVRLDGDLDPLTGETVLTALNAVLDAEARSGLPDDRTPPQRRADALGEICRRWLDRPDRPTVGGERPHLTVTISAEDLAGGGSGLLEHTGPIPTEQVERMVCEDAVMRIVRRAESEVLDVGRRVRTLSAGMRRAVIARDSVCRFPGCDRPHPGVIVTTSST